MVFDRYALPGTGPVGPPPKKGRVQRALGDLAPTDVWCLDNLDKFLFRLAGRRVLESCGLLGGWVLAQDRVACVFRHVNLGPIGVLVSDVAQGAPDGVGVEETVEQLAGLNAGDIAEWRRRGWVAGGIVWNGAPAGLVLPWSDRPPQPGDPMLGDEVSLETKPRSTYPDPVEAAFDDLRFSVAHDMWAATVLTRLATYPLEDERSALRLAACWLVGPDSFAYVESHLWPPPELPRCTDLLAASLESGQSHLRFGEVIAPQRPTSVDVFVRLRHQEMELDAISTYPTAAVGRRTQRGGIWWERHFTALLELASPTVDRMGPVLRAALDDVSNC